MKVRVMHPHRAVHPRKSAFLRIVRCLADSLGLRVAAFTFSIVKEFTKINAGRILLLHWLFWLPHDLCMLGSLGWRFREKRVWP